MGILGIDDEDIFGGHGEPGHDGAVVADEIFFRLPDSFLQHFHIGDTDLLLTGQQHVNVAVLNVAFPDGLFLGHGLVVETVDKGLIAVDFVAAFGQLSQVGGEDVADGSIQALAQAQIAFQIFALGLDHNENSFVRRYRMHFQIFHISMLPGRMK